MADYFRKKEKGKSTSLVPVDCSLEYETELAYLIDYGGATKIWLPKSECDWDGAGTMMVSEWLAIEKGLV